MKSSVNSALFALIYSAITLFFYHFPLFSFAFKNVDAHSLNGMVIIVILAFTQLASVFILVMALSFIQIIVKPLCILLLLINSVAYYFITTYNVILDKTMIGNIFNTKISEASELFNPKILLYILFLGILPSLFIARIKIRRLPLAKHIAVIVVALLLTITIGYMNGKTWLWFDKNAKHIGGLSLPLSYVGNTIRYFKKAAENDRVDTQIPNATFINNKPTIVVLVIGESARAASFSLYGYPRNTNPYLSKDHVVAMSNATSCTTYTTESIKCMLSHQGSHSSHTLYEALPSYLQRQHVNVMWRSNNWGEPKLHVAKYESTDEIRQRCNNSSDCKLPSSNYDEVMLYQLDDDIKKHLQENTLVILHQSGSHGPSYYTKYPAQFETYKPVCKSVELQKCTHEELINAYDNTIGYTDFFLHNVISLLKSLDNTSSVMIYLSDHGESLGESNFYLHGTPYFLAPKFQKEIPFIVWMSDKFKTEHQLTNDTLGKRLHNSQENVFNSVMGAFGARSDFYNKELDIFSH